ncbi:hypothetical protein [Pontibacter sp. G13]|uniref:hypothetical protein n=1 Tax=Pontibacter sp. G13 TaxID=3074898 RepID=UPI002889231A|nr:hypothetical protein [Pontibacter sp. G13]WNJ20960.1 hypothetical protein RJD25_10830 [Pontibacter sp. G13]
MTHHEKNLATFQNLCVIAHLDGELDAAEIAFLEEMAGTMGLSEQDILPLISQGASLEFIIPNSEPERYMEIRLVVLMMLSDGIMQPQEYQGCLTLANMMGIDKEYLDEIVAFYTDKQRERLRHRGIFQNFYLIAAADNLIDEDESKLLMEVAQNLGLGQQDIDFVVENAHQLDFIIPEDKEERYFTLKNLVYMMIVNGRIDQREYELCIKFAEMIDMSNREVEAIINEYESIQQERESHQDSIDQFNLNLYLDIYASLLNMPIPPSEVIDKIEEVIHLRKLDITIDNSEEATRTFFYLVWLCIVRGKRLNPEMMASLDMLFELVRTHGNYKAMMDFLIRQEQTHGGSAINLTTLELATIKEQIAQGLG